MRETWESANGETYRSWNAPRFLQPIMLIRNELSPIWEKCRIPGQLQRIEQLGHLSPTFASRTRLTAPFPEGFALIAGFWPG